MFLRIFFVFKANTKYSSKVPKYTALNKNT